MHCASPCEVSDKRRTEMKTAPHMTPCSGNVGSSESSQCFFYSLNAAVYKPVTR